MQFPDCIMKHFSFHSPMNKFNYQHFPFRNWDDNGRGGPAFKLDFTPKTMSATQLTAPAPVATASASASAAPMSGVSQILQPPTGPTGPFKDWPGFDPSKQPTTTAPAAIVSSAVAVSQ